MTFVHKFEPEKEEKSINGRIKKILTGISVLIILLVVLQIWVTHNVISYGQKYENLETLKNTLESENQVLAYQIASQSALINIASRSATLGLTDKKDIQYIR